MEYQYKMIGADGREYGPVPLDEMISWTREGRVAPFTQIWRSDTTLWTAASQYEELKPHLPAITSPQPPAYSDISSKPAGCWIRLGAYMLDGILLNIVMRLIFHGTYERLEALGRITAPDMQTLLDALSSLFIVFTGYALLSMFYFILMNGRYGATLGKLAVGIKIVNVDGSPLGYRRAFWRYSAEVINVFTLGIGYLMVAFREDKRGLHDLIAKTRVIYRD